MEGGVDSLSAHGYCSFIVLVLFHIPCIVICLGPFFPLLFFLARGSVFITLEQ